MRKKIIRSIALFVVPFFAYLLIKFLYLTNKKEFIISDDDSKSDDIFIMACWHSNLIMLPYAYFQCRKNLKAKIIISEHFDGDISAKLWSYFKLGAIRGSSRRGGAKALIESIKELKNGYDLGITPDGPKGPIHQVANGVIVMAQKADVKIRLVAIKPTKYWELNTWDKLVIPKPFGTIRYYVSDLKNVKDMQIEDAKILVKKGLHNYEI